MDFSGFSVNSLEIRNRAGGTLATLTGKVFIQAGSGVAVETEGQTIRISTGREYTDPDDCYILKLRALIEGGTVDDCQGGSATFSGMPYYIARINGEPGNDVNNYDFYGSACGQVGIWNPAGPDGSEEATPEQPSDPASGYVDDGSLLNDDGALEILDICEACIDCKEYEDIKTLMERIRSFQYWDVHRNLYNDVPIPGESGEPDIPDPGPGQLALFRQYQSTIHYWNYLVHERCIPLELIRGSRRFFGIQSGYFLKDCLTISNVTQVLVVNIDWADTAAEYVSFEFTNVKTHMGNELPPPPMNVVKNAGALYTLTIEYPELSYREFYMWQIVARPVDDDKTLEINGVSVESTWNNSHIGASVSRDKSIAL